ncbi:MAG TPA: glycosyltransferase family 1 protein [Candidatus Kapabacteria bacterium]|jgi:UDP-galactopyranose mutase|nr:glycosyltransferase family 1 protein [Candidatus Kapabacteria bacterium]
MNNTTPNPSLPRESATTSTPDLICLSHLRWDFVFQRPQHLLTRCARERRVFFVEEPYFDAEGAARLDVSHRGDGLYVAVPHLPAGVTQDEAEAMQRELLDHLRQEHSIGELILWYYTPMAIGFADHLEPVVTVFDAMDELSAFKNAPQQLIEREARVFERADLVFTGGQSLYEAKKHRHPHVYAFPSSIDREHFASARAATDDPVDQASIPHPRIGFFGVLDERFDRDLLAGLAAARPDWQFVMIGPVVKIDPSELPRAANIHYLGGKQYAELPAYIAGWDVATLLFARNESTRFISPTKTPEYLAAGRPVVSTSIRDVVRPYGDDGLVAIADEVDEFVAAIERMLAMEDREAWLERVDAFLAKTSWDRTWASMAGLINSVQNGRGAVSSGGARADARQAQD